MEILIFLALCVYLATADTHSYQYFETAVTPGTNFPEYTVVALIDGVLFEYYDSKSRRYIPKTEWMEQNEEPEYWDGFTQQSQGDEELYKNGVVTLMQRFNHTRGVHTLQVMYGCEIDDDGTTRGYIQYGYDGEDFISLDLETLTWVAPTPQALITKNKWETTGVAIQRKNYLENICINSLKRHLSFGKESLERKVRPEASVFQRRSSSPELVCHATGFFPKSVEITWQKDSEDVHEDVEFRETLPNQDGSFQKRSILKVPAEDLQKHNYTCVIQHSSLGEELVLPVSERRILRGGGSDGGSGGGSDGAPNIIVVCVVAGFLVLVAVGIVVWRWKMNSGFNSVPSGS